MPAYPDNAYLTKIGTLAYAVARLEWLVLGDLTGQADRLPQYLTVTRMAGLTTGQIAKLVSEASVQVDDSAASEWLTVGGQHLRSAAAIRNHLLHARPATIEGAQRLYRWRIGERSADTFPISDAWLDERIVEVEAMCREVDRAPMAAWQQ